MASHTCTVHLEVNVHEERLFPLEEFVNEIDEEG
jgi:hypothetical protein